MRILMVIIAAMIVAGGTGWYVLQSVNQSAAPAAVAQIEAPRPVEVYAPRTALSAGSIIVPEHLEAIAIGGGALTPEMIEAGDAGQKILVGSVARHPLPMGVPIARSATVQPGERGFLAAVLPKGKRAISIPVSEITGVSGLLLPGDRVDLILTYSISGDLIESGRDIRASETIMANLRVLALDQRLNAPGPAKPGEPATPPPPMARTATLEATPQQAEMITLATTLGDLSLVLNSVRDGGEPDAEDERLTQVSTAAALLARVQNPSIRDMTLDSDVTSLLRRELAATDSAADQAPAIRSAAGSVIPLNDRLYSVQVVRGASTGDVKIEPALAAEVTENVAE